MQGRTVHHEARPFTAYERARLNAMLGQALADPTVKAELVERRSTGVMDQFGVPDDIQAWLRLLPARSLKEIAAAIRYHP